METLIALNLEINLGAMACEFALQVVAILKGLGFSICHSSWNFSLLIPPSNYSF